MKHNTDETPVFLVRAIEAEKQPIGVKTLAAILGCSIDTVYRAVRKGKIPSFQNSGMIMFDPATLSNYFRKYPAMVGRYARLT